MKNRFGVRVFFIIILILPVVVPVNTWADSSDILPPEVAHTQTSQHIDDPKTSKKPLVPYLCLKTPRHTTQLSQTKASSTLYPGSLKANISRISAYYGWKDTVWVASVDYNWVGTTSVKAANLQGILRKILNDYPLQALFYEGNHVLVIAPRTLR